MNGDRPFRLLYRHVAMDAWMQRCYRDADRRDSAAVALRAERYVVECYDVLALPVEQAAR